MEESIRLGRVAGIGIGANWSVLVIFWLVAWNLADLILPGDAPGYATGEYWAAGVVAATVFFVCLLAHELAHALVARRIGLPVEGITLWLFGGVSKLGGDAPDARSELRVAVAGPLTSIGAGAVLALAAVALAPVGELVSTTAAWLAGINVLLAVFNLVPAFPLDGGRVLRAAVWRRSGDRLRATEVAAGAGRTFAYVLIGVGLLSATAGELIGGLWFVFLGWFLLGAARAEQGQVEADLLLGDTSVRDVMSSPVRTVRPDLDVDELLHQHVLRLQHSAYPVVDDGDRPLGLVTLDGIRKVPPDARAWTRVDRIATPADRLTLVGPDETLAAVLPRLDPRQSSRALVVDHGRLVGLLSSADIHRALQLAQLARTSTSRLGKE